MKGLPTVQYLSEQLNVSPSYLSDMLRTLTGQNTQQLIHNQLIDKAKEILTVTNLSVSEMHIDLALNIRNHSANCSRNKTNLSPLEFRQSFN